MPQLKLKVSLIIMHHKCWKNKWKFRFMAKNRFAILSIAPVFLGHFQRKKNNRFLHQEIITICTKLLPFFFLNFLSFISGYRFLILCDKVRTHHTRNEEK